MENKNNLSCNDNLKLIMKYLKISGYGIDNWSLENLKETLSSPSSSRTELLFWVLDMFGLSYPTQEKRIFKQSIINKIVSDLSALGICRPQDMNLVDGSGNVASQLVFWRNLLDLGLKLRSNLSSSLCYTSDVLFHSVIHSSHYEDCMKDEDLNLLPKDLQLQYKNFSKKGSVPRQRITELEEKIRRERQMQESQPHRNGRVGELTDLTDRISSLSTRSSAFITTYETSLSPWCKGSDLSPPDAFQETNQIVAQCFEQLQQYQKSVALAVSVESSHEQLLQKMRALKQDKTPSAAALLESIVNS